VAKNVEKRVQKDVKPFVGKQVEPRSVLGDEDSTVPGEAAIDVL